MTLIAETPLARLDNEERLINGNLKEPGSTPGSFFYRGDFAIKLAPRVAGNVFPPHLKADQVMLSARAGDPQLPFFTCHLQSFETLKPLVDLLGDALGASGKYFAFCSNIKPRQRYRVKAGAATFYILPLAQGTAFNELLDLIGVERDDLKKLSALAKIETIEKAALAFDASYEEISYERGLEVMSAA
ncbi:MAG: hypothetical protein ABW321_25920 [Polyangiales bacterium]